jgi:hypothetical protein
MSLAKGTASTLLYKQEVAFNETPTDKETLTSTTAVTPALGETIDIVVATDPSVLFPVGTLVRAQSDAAPTTSYMVGRVTVSHVGPPHHLKIFVTEISAATEKADWTIYSQMTYLSFVNESLGGTINSIVSAEITANRAVTAVRGGNITTNGSLSTEFGPFKNARFLQHALGMSALPVFASVESGFQAYEHSKIYNVGQYVKFTIVQDYLFLCTKSGTTHASTDLTAVAWQVNGTTEWKLVGDLATMVFGQWSFAPPAAGVSFVSPGLMFEKRVKGAAAELDIQFSGVRLNGFTLNLAQEGLMTAEWPLIASQQHNLASRHDAAAECYGPSTDTPFIGTDCVVYMASGAAQGTTSGALKYLCLPWPTGTGNLALTSRPVRDGSLALTNQFDESVYTVGSRYRREIPEGMRQITGTLNMFFEDSTEFSAFLGETELTLELVLIVNTNLMVIRLPYVKITGQGTPAISGPGVITCAYNFTAYKGGTESDIRIDVYGAQSKELF